MPYKYITIVENESIVAQQVKAELEKLGYAVAGVHASGENAIEGIKTAKPDLVLMDIKLKGTMNGIETAERIKKEHGIPVIFLTNNSEESTISRASLNEPYGYILKTAHGQELQMVVQMAFYKHNIDRENERLIQEFKHALERIKLLSGMLHICPGCKKIRNDKGHWKDIEEIIRDHSGAKISHSNCPECGKKKLDEFHEMKRKRDPKNVAGPNKSSSS